jgi:hypothetical protein
MEKACIPQGSRAAQSSSPIDVARINRLISVGEDEVRAVIEVETAGGGFDALGRP